MLREEYCSTKIAKLDEVGEFTSLTNGYDLS